jgi:hypothetical protein
VQAASTAAAALRSVGKANPPSVAMKSGVYSSSATHV